MNNFRQRMTNKITHQFLGKIAIREKVEKKNDARVSSYFKILL